MAVGGDGQSLWTVRCECFAEPHPLPPCERLERTHGETATFRRAKPCEPSCTGLRFTELCGCCGAGFHWYHQIQPSPVDGLP